MKLDKRVTTTLYCLSALTTACEYFQPRDTVQSSRPLKEYANVHNFLPDIAYLDPVLHNGDH